MKIQELSLQQTVEIMESKLTDTSSLRRLDKDEDIIYCGPSFFHHSAQLMKNQSHQVKDYDQVDPRCFLKAKLFPDNYSICIFDTGYRLDSLHLDLKFESIKYFKSLLCPDHNYENALRNFSIPTDKILDLASGQKTIKKERITAANVVVDKYSDLPIPIKDELSKIRVSFNESYPNSKDLWIPFEFFHNSISLKMIEKIYCKNLEITQQRSVLERKRKTRPADAKRKGRKIDGKRKARQDDGGFFSKIRYKHEQRSVDKIDYTAKREMESLTEYYHPILDYKESTDCTDSKQQVRLDTYLYNFDKWVTKLNKRVRKKTEKGYPEFDFIEKLKYSDQTGYPKDPKHKVIHIMLNNNPATSKNSCKYLYRMGIMTHIYNEHLLDRWEESYEDTNRQNNIINCQKRKMREEQKEIDAVDAELSSQRV